MDIKFFLLISILISFNRHQAQTTISCYCEPMDSVSEALKNSDLVISGKVLAISLRRMISVMSPAVDSLGGEYLELHNIIVNEFAVHVRRIYEGRSESDTLILRTEPETGCGFILENDQTYIFYLNHPGSHLTDRCDFESRNSHFTTSVCTRTRLFDKKEEDDILRSGSR